MKSILEKSFLGLLIVALIHSNKFYGQSSSALNSLTGLQTAPAQYLGSSTDHDVIFKSFNTERFRLKQSDATFKLALTTNFVGAIGGAKILGAQGQTASSPAYSFNVTGEAGLGIFRPLANTMAFSTNGIERLRVLSSGNVGIGTSVPDQTLDINGRMRIRFGVIQKGGVAITNVSDLGLYSLDATSWMRFVTNNGPIQFYSDGGINSIGTNPLMTILETGKVGINATNPTARFQVDNGVGKVAMGSFFSGNPFYFSSYVGWNAAKGATGWFLDTDGANNGGAVIATSVQGEMRFISLPSSNGTLQQTKTDVQILDATKMTLRSDGKIGIGTGINYTGTFKLYVESGILTEKVKVAVKNSAAWSDFVFDNDYELMPLEEIERFINKNNHLPSIPSAKEVVENGIDLGEMNAKLLQKIEELTLYIITMNKEIGYLKFKIEEKN
jgi:hypothetical protein